MRNIHDLFHGRMGPPNYIGESDKEYQKLLRQCETLTEELKSRFDPDDYKLHKQLFEMHTKLAGLDMESHYLQGFRDGAGIMLDVLTGDNSPD